MRAMLLLFDVDGTLINSGAGRKAFNRAFEQRFGIREATHEVDMAGRTDPAIYGDVCAKFGLDPATFDSWKAEFLFHLAAALRDEPGCILPGVKALVEACHHDPEFTLALGTGNVEEGARLKLAPHGLNPFFPTGGYGTDGATRADLIAAGIQKAERLVGRPFDRVAVIGDTPHDVACGKANGCLTVAVATGRHSLDDLATARPDILLPNFAEAEQTLAHFKRLLT